MIMLPAVHPLSGLFRWPALLREARAAAFSRKPSVLVVVVYTPKKLYCKRLMYAVYESLTYQNKHLLLVDENQYPALSTFSPGEMIAAMGRTYGINYARLYGHDYVLFLDADVEPPPDLIEQLMAMDKPMAAAACAARGNENLCVGHNYADRERTERLPLQRKDCEGIKPVDGIGAGCLLIHKRVFQSVDYDGYHGPDTNPGRYTGSDEHFQNNVYRAMKIHPWVNFDIRPWHYDDSGWAYRLWGYKKWYRTNDQQLLGFKY